MASDMIRVGTFDELKEKGVKVVHGGGRVLAVFVHDGQVHAVDNRCPHMGFPLHRGTVKDGILTCHWHEARFDLCSGCAFDAFADDVPAFDTAVRDGVVYVASSPRRTEDAAYHLGRLRKGMLEGVGLVQAKSIIGLLKSGSEWREIVGAVALLAVERRESWGSGMTTLAIVARLMPYLGKETAYFALSYATNMIAGEIAQAMPRRRRLPLDGPHDPELLRRWMRHWVKSRHRDGAERVLLTAIAAGALSAELTELVFSAETDRVFSAQGHTLDGANKAMELVEIVGRDRAADLLPLVAPTMAISRGAEEDAHWHQPIEIIEPLRIAEGRLTDTLGQGRDRQWKEDPALIATLLGENPLAIISALEGALRAGARPTDLSKRISYAAALRLARFAISNDVSDWFNPQHTFIYTNAVHQMVKRAATPLTIRAIFHAALCVYMDRFLNVPPAHLPGEREGLDDLPSDGAELRKQLLHVLDQRAEINAAARLVARHVRLGHPLDALIDTLTYATVREDLDFHTIQVLEAGVQQCQEWVGRPEVEHILVGVVRQLAAFCPTRRGSLQRATIALRLHRGENIYEEE